MRLPQAHNPLANAPAMVLPAMAPRSAVGPQEASSAAPSPDQTLQNLLAMMGHSGAQAAPSASVADAADPAHRAPGGKTLVVGDSLGVGTTPALEHLIGHVDSNVEGGRSSASGVAALRAKLSTGHQYGKIVLDLGTNDTTAKALHESLATAERLAPNAELYVPTLNGPYDTAHKNALLRKFAANHSNVHLVPWAGNHNVGPDGIHSTAGGYAKRARLIAGVMGRK